MSFSINGFLRPLRPLLILLAFPGAAFASQACDGVDTALTEARKSEYTGLVAAAMEGKVKPAAVSFRAFMKSGDWSAVYVSTPVADDGVLFFRNVDGTQKFKDAWGGVADESEREKVVTWASKLGAPEDLARCFAETVIRN